MGEEVTPEVAARFRASVPMGKVLEKTDTLTMVANAAVYLCSDEAAFVSGVNLPVDGAATVHAPSVGKRILVLGKARPKREKPKSQQSEKGNQGQPSRCDTHGAGFYLPEDVPSHEKGD